MKKVAIILNGSGGVGKGTFVSVLKKHVSVYEYSIVNKVKEIMVYSGVPINEKTEEVRMAMSDLKLLLERWDIPYKDVVQRYNSFINIDHSCDLNIFSVDMREKHDIERFSKEFNAVKVLVVNDRVKQITSNVADANVYDVDYDFVINNNGTLEDLEKEVVRFINFIS